MTPEEFANLETGASFTRQKKVYTMVRRDELSIVGHPASDPAFLVHFYVSQAAEMTIVPSTPTLERPSESSHGFPALKRSEPRLPAPYMHPETGGRRLCVDLDGVLTEARDVISRDTIGTPTSGAMDFLERAYKSNLEIYICTHCSSATVWDWLRI